jgi:hypothetical protein
MYKQVKNLIDGGLMNCILRIADNAFIPFEPTSIDYQEYLDWLAEGNTPLPADEVTQ